MNTLLLIAGVLTAITALIHSIAGELTTIRLLTKTDLPQVPKTELRAGWYMVTVHLLVSAIMLFVLAADTDQNFLIGKFLALQFWGYGLVFLLLAFIKKIKAFQVPQWVLLFIIAGLIFWGSVR